MKRELVLLHGWGFQSNVWEHFIPYLTVHFNITTLDLLGFGNNTTFNETLTLHSLTKHVLENSPDSAVFLGWSLGGLIAMNIAAHYPERITHLITIASTPKFTADTHWPGMLPTVLEKFSNRLAMDFQATLQQFILLQFQGCHVDRSVIKSLWQQVADSRAPSEQRLSDGLIILNNADLRNALIHIQCPQLYLFGRCDTLVPPAVANKVKKLTKNAKINVLPKVSHAPFLTNPRLCVDKIEAFL